MLLQKPRFRSFSWLNSVLLYICIFAYIYINIYFLYIFIPWWILELFPCKIAVLNMGMHISFWVNVFIFFRYIPRIGIARSFGSSIFNCLRNFNALISIVAAPIYTPNSAQCIPFLNILSNTSYFLSFW